MGACWKTTVVMELGGNDTSPFLDIMVCLSKSLCLWLLCWFLAWTESAVLLFWPVTDFFTEAEWFSWLKQLVFSPGGLSIQRRVVLWVCEETPVLVWAAGAAQVMKWGPEQGNRNALGLPWKEWLLPSVLYCWVLHIPTAGSLAGVAFS